MSGERLSPRPSKGRPCVRSLLDYQRGKGQNINFSLQIPSWSWEAVKSQVLWPESVPGLARQPLQDRCAFRVGDCTGPAAVAAGLIISAAHEYYDNWAAAAGRWLWDRQHPSFWTDQGGGDTKPGSNESWQCE